MVDQDSTTSAVLDHPPDPLGPPSSSLNTTRTRPLPLPPRPSPPLPPPPSTDTGDSTPNPSTARFIGLEMQGQGQGQGGTRTRMMAAEGPSSLPLAPLPHHLIPFLLPSSPVSSSSSSSPSTSHASPRSSSLDVLTSTPTPTPTPSLTPNAPLSPSEKTSLFTSIYLLSASSGASDTLEWLLALPPPAPPSSLTPPAAVPYPDSLPRKWINLHATDEEGNPALVLCTALGHAEGVRVLVEAGVDVELGDRAGWTPLHWAVQNNDIPLASYLLNHGASPLSLSHKGLTPRNLVPRGPDGGVMREVLSSAWEAKVERDRERVREGEREREREREREEREKEEEEMELRARLEESDSEKERRRGTVERKSSAGEVSSLLRRGHWHGYGYGYGGGAATATGAEEEDRRRAAAARKRDEKVRLSQAALEASRWLEVEFDVLGFSSRGGGVDYDDEDGDDGEDEEDTDEEEEEDEGAEEDENQDGTDIPAPPPAAPSPAAEAPSFPVPVSVASVGVGIGRAPVPSSSSSKSKFRWTSVLPSEMIVFALGDLSPIFDLIITHTRPFCRPRKQRYVPATVVFLCARYAAAYGTNELLEELVVGAMERIESAVHDRPDDASCSSFHLSNCLMLLYYLRRDSTLSRLTLLNGMQTHLRDLINEIFVFIIRDAERRIDRVLEGAMLEFEQMKGLSEGLRMEGEWRVGGFVKKLTGGRAGAKKVLGGGGGGGGQESAGSSPNGTGAAAGLGGLFGVGVGGRDGGGGIETSPRSAGGAGAANSGGKKEKEEPSPRMITALLSSTLFILQSYEIPPSIVVQAFSQLFYWIACELFNRLLTQRKYLCRSKALQIRLNVSILEDWARSSLLPPSMISVHFAPLNQLLQWLQTLSSEASIDGLIGTVQSLRSLNPLQLRRAVREYRYEVDESRMNDECSQYLMQIQKQWERMRVLKTVEAVGGPAGGANSLSPQVEGAQAMSRGSSGSTTSSVTSEERQEQEKVTRMIDEVFSDPSSFGSYTPPGGSEALGELLNSRYMLPFAVPSSAEMLLNFDRGDAFGPFSTRHTPDAPSSSSGTLTPSHSTTSLSSATVYPTSRRSSLAPSFSSASRHSNEEDNPIRKKRKREYVPVLPDSFWALMDEARQQARVSAMASRIMQPQPPAPIAQEEQKEEQERTRDWVQGGANGHVRRLDRGQGQGLGLGDVGVASEGQTDWRGRQVPREGELDGGDESESGSELPEEGDSFDRGVQETPRARSGPFEQQVMYKG